MTIYWAGRLFNMAEIHWNQACADELRDRGFTVLLPQEDAEKFKLKDGSYDLNALAEDCAKNSMEADLGVYNLDGSDVDSGTAVEVGLRLGHIASQQIPDRKYGSIGIRTDFRALSEDSEINVNAMFRLLDKVIFVDPNSTIYDVCDKIEDYINSQS